MKVSYLCHDVQESKLMESCIAKDLVRLKGTWLHPEPQRNLNILYVHCVIITDVGDG